MSQFIIATNNSSAAQRNAITEHVKSKGWAWWHHFEDLWMVSTSAYEEVDYDGTTSEQLFNELVKLPLLGKNAFLLVIRLPSRGLPMTHSGFGPQEGWEWTKKYWSEVG